MPRETIKIIICDEDKIKTRDTRYKLEKEPTFVVRISKGPNDLLDEITEFQPRIIIIEAFYPSMDKAITPDSPCQDIMTSNGYALEMFENKNALLPRIRAQIDTNTTKIIIYSKYRAGGSRMILDALGYDGLHFIDKDKPFSNAKRPLRKYYKPIAPDHKRLLIEINKALKE